MPVIDIDSLRKILELEQKKGYSDSAVIGGLDKFIRQWADKTIDGNYRPFPAGKIPEITSADSKYASLTIKERQAWVKNVLEFAD